MINLAGVGDCDTTIRQELEEAGIPVLQAPFSSRGEVPTSLYGEKNGFQFSRAWSYWVAYGHMPLGAAWNIYNNPKGYAVRAGGDCTAPMPDENSYFVNWYTDEWLQIVPDGEYQKVLDMKFLTDEWKAEFQARNIRDSDAATRNSFVDLYHIDTQGGLDLFSSVVDGLTNPA